MRKTTILGLVAMLMIIIAIFLPMFAYAGIEFKLLEDEQRAASGYIVMVLAALMGVCSFLANKKHLFAIGTLIFAGLLALISMVWFGDAKEVGAEIGTGLMLYLVGSILGVVSAILGFMKK